jgi:hypothetical protein
MAPSVALPMDIVEPPDPADEDGYAEWLMKLHDWWDADDDDFLELEFSPGHHLPGAGNESLTAIPDSPTSPHAHQAALVSPGPHLSRPGTEHPPITPERPSPPQAHSYHPESPSHLSRGREIFAFIGGKETLGGLERWFSPRGQDLAFLLSRIGLIRPRSVLI